MRFTLLCLIIICLVACQKKTLPVISERPSTRSIGIEDTTTLTGNAESGRLLFSNRCDRCHGLPEIKSYSLKRWDIIMESMAPRAKMNRQEKEDVLVYVRSSFKM